MIKVRIYFTIILFAVFSSFDSIGKDRSSFFEVLSGKSEANIDKEIARLESESPTSLTKARRGALLMKKAEFVKGAGNKVKTFKAGAKLLEGEIAESPDNVEYRFMRLTIQEHAPGILKYNKNVQADKQLIISSFKKLDEDLKKVIRNYSEDSKIIKTVDLR
jgi:hypothetical protein